VRSKLPFGDEEQTVFGNDDNVKDKGKPPRGACQFSPSLKITVTEGEPPPLSVHAPSPTANLEAAGEDFGASAKVSLESRMGNLENAVRTLTELVVRIDKKLDEVCVWVWVEYLYEMLWVCVCVVCVSAHEKTLCKRSQVLLCKSIIRSIRRVCVYVCVCVCACVCACVCVCVEYLNEILCACVCACVRACARAQMRECSRTLTDDLAWINKKRDQVCVLRARVFLSVEVAG